jgi:hypothetical protein
MKTHIVLIYLILAAALLAACVEPGPGAGVTPAAGTPTSAPPTPGVTPSPAAVNVPQKVVDLARAYLAAQLHPANPADLKLVSGEAVEWPDSCLGVNNKEMACLTVITPGYRLVFEYQSGRYELHTDAEAKNIVVAEAPQGKLSSIVFSWRARDAADVCMSLDIDSSMRAYWGACDAGALHSGPFVNALHAEELNHFLDAYSPFAADSLDGGLSLNGRGQGELPNMATRALAEWAHMVWQEQSLGRTDETAGLALNLSRDSGCDTLKLYNSGVFYRSNCKSAQPGIAPRYLTGDQLDELFAWLDRYATFDYSGKDASGAAVQLSFTGLGRETADAATQAQIVAWAEQLYSNP